MEGLVDVKRRRASSSSSATAESGDTLRVRTGKQCRYSRKYKPRKTRTQTKPSDAELARRAALAHQKERENRQRQMAKLIEDSLGMNDVLGQASGITKKGESKKRKLKHVNSLTLCDTTRIMEPRVQNVVVRGLMDFYMQPTLQFELGASYDAQSFPAMTFTNHNPRLRVIMQQLSSGTDRTVTVNIAGAVNVTAAWITLHRLRRRIMLNPERWYSEQDIKERKHLKMNVRNVYAVNVTCSARIGREISLQKFAQLHNRNDSDIRLTKKFPGLTWTMPPSASSYIAAPGKRVAIIFGTGEVNLLGFKDVQEVDDAKRLIRYIEQSAAV